MLSAAQRAAFREQGFLALPRLAAATEVASLRAALEALVSRGVGSEAWSERREGDESDPIMCQRSFIDSPGLLLPVYARTRLFARACAIAQQLLGDDALPRGAYSFYKPPFRGVTTPWHQDGAYLPPGSDAELLTVWVPLQDTDVANGCMHFVPGSHRAAPRPHRHVNDDPRHPVLVTDADDGEREAAVPCVLPSGGATLHTTWTLHGAGPNRSAAPRHALIFDFVRGGHP